MDPNVNLYQFSARAISGRDVSLAEYQGKVMLIVNTASKCGFTPQYEGLEKLYEEFRDRGLVVLGFPCNQFGSQEPGTESDIARFCSVNYGVSFPMFSKVEVNGDNVDPLFRFLKEAKPGIFGTTRIKWNFTKFLVDRSGRPVARYATRTAPLKLKPAIERLL